MDFEHFRSCVLTQLGFRVMDGICPGPLLAGSRLEHSPNSLCQTCFPWIPRTWCIYGLHNESAARTYAPPEVRGADFPCNGIHASFRALDPARSDLRLWRRLPTLWSSSKLEEQPNCWSHNHGRD